MNYNSFFCIGLCLCLQVLGLSLKAQSFNNLDVLDPVYSVTEVEFALYNPTDDLVSVGVIVSQDTTYLLQGSIIIQDIVLSRGEVDVPPKDTVMYSSQLHYSQQDYCSAYLHDVCEEHSAAPANTTAIKVLNASDNFSIYPNPARDFVYVDSRMETSEDFQLEVYDSVGRLIKSQLWNPAERAMLDIRNFSKGVYSLKLVSGKSAHQFKLSVW